MKKKSRKTITLKYQVSISVYRRIAHLMQYAQPGALENLCVQKLGRRSAQTRKFASSDNQFPLASDARNTRERAQSRARRSCNLCLWPKESTIVALERQREHKVGPFSPNRSPSGVGRHRPVGSMHASPCRQGRRGETEDLESRSPWPACSTFRGHRRFVHASGVSRARAAEGPRGSSAGPGALCSTETGGWNP
jgi:hypothetical protein